MKLQLERKVYTETSTVGELSIDGKFFCYTLEDTVRQPGIKVYGKTAIPSGAYPVSMTFSPKFGKPMPLVNGVRNYVGVRIHPGNTAADTEGCILVGHTKGNNFIGESRKAFGDLLPQIEKACKNRESVTLVIHDNVPTEELPTVVAAKKAAK